MVRPVVTAVRVRVIPGIISCVLGLERVAQEIVMDDEVPIGPGIDREAGETAVNGSIDDGTPARIEQTNTDVRVPLQKIIIDNCSIALCST